MSDMPLSEKTLRAAALACWENAESLSAEAKLLGDHQYGARAVALAILGLEEFAKAIGYTVAALSREPRDVLVRKLRHLTSHEVKHLVAWTAEYAQIVTQDWIDGVEWQTGYRPSAEGRFAAQLSHLAQGGLGYFLEEPREARTFFKTRREMKRTTPSGLAGEDIDVLLASDKKNAALNAAIFGRLVEFVGGNETGAKGIDELRTLDR